MNDKPASRAATFVDRLWVRIAIVTLAAGVGAAVGCSEPSDAKPTETVSQELSCSDGCGVTAFFCGIGCALQHANGPIDLPACIAECDEAEKQCLLDCPTETCSGSCSGDDDQCFSNCMDNEGSVSCCWEACEACGTGS